MLSKEFIQKLAKVRADELFTKEYYHTVTDSWYLDEMFRFEGMKVGKESRKPTEEEMDIYMDFLSEYFASYKEKFYSCELAQDCYGKCIDEFRKIFEFIEYGNKNYSKFEIDEQTIKNLKDIANIFVKKHNEFCSEDKACSNQD